MNFTKVTVFFLSAVFLLSSGLWAQSDWNQSKFGIGVNVGLQHIYGNIQPAGVGLASEASLRYFMSQRLNFSLSAGYGELNDGFFERHFYTTVLNADLKAQLNLLTSRFRPFISAGVGIANYTFNVADANFYTAVYKQEFGASWATELNNDVAGNDGEAYSTPAYIVGGGFDFLLSPKWGLNGYVDYRFTDSDDLDGGYMQTYSTANDGYLNGRLGLTYYMGASGKTRAGEDAYSGLEEFQLEPEGGQAGEIVWEESGAPTPEAQATDYSELQSRVRNLNQELENKEESISELEAQIASQEERIRSLERELNEVAGQMGTAPVSGGGNYKMVYEQAVQQFYSRNYSSAMSSFRSLLNQYPGHKLASNCQYWIGECQFATGNYSQAAQSFQAVLNYDSSYKFDDALIMLGRTYMKLGNNENARNYLQRLLNEYPDSEYVGKARNWLNRM